MEMYNCGPHSSLSHDLGIAKPHSTLSHDIGIGKVTFSMTLLNFDIHLTLGQKVCWYTKNSKKKVFFFQWYFRKSVFSMWQFPFLKNVIVYKFEYDYLGQL